MKGILKSAGEQSRRHTSHAYRCCDPIAGNHPHSVWVFDHLVPNIGEINIFGFKMYVWTSDSSSSITIVKSLLLRQPRCSRRQQYKLLCPCDSRNPCDTSCKRQSVWKRLPTSKYVIPLAPVTVLMLAEYCIPTVPLANAAP